MPSFRVEMNYLKIYCNLIRNAEKRGYSKKKAKEQGMYVEGHHTFPVSIFGKNKRIVYLTAREHYVAHALLEKIYLKRYGLKHWKTIKMNQAFFCMNAKNNSQTKYISILYESAKKRHSILKTGVPFEEERKLKISRALKGKRKPPKTSEHIKKFSEKMKGVKKGDEHKLKIGKSLKKYWENGGRNISGKNNSFYKKTHSEEIKSLLSDLRCKFEYTFISPDGKIYKIINAKQFCKDNKLNEKKMYEVSNNKIESYKGWEFAKKQEKWYNKQDDTISLQ